MYHLTHKQWFNAYANSRDNIHKLISNINDIPPSDSSTENTNKHKEVERTSVKDWSSDFLGYLRIIFDIVVGLCLAIARIVVCVVGIITCLAVLYMLVTGKSFVINIQEMINSFIR